MKAFNRLNPKQKRMAVVGGALAGAVVIISISMANQPDSTPAVRSADNSIRHVLTDRDSREVTMGSLATQLAAAQRENESLREEFARLRADVSSSSSAGISSEVSRKMDSLSREIDLLREENLELRERTETLNLSALEGLETAPSVSDSGEEPSTSAERAEPSEAPQVVEAQPEPREPTPTFESPGSEDLTPESVFEQRPVTRRTAPGGPGGQQGTVEEEGEPAPGLSITTFYQEDHPADQEVAGEDPAVYMPSGSIVSGVLLNGLDAPTGQGARRDPFPVTVRVKHDAILPNRYSSDVKECFMLLSGHGDLSTERAYLRGNNISCMTDDGDVIETEMRGYAVGEDGKAGIRGRLVSKQGAMIARSMVAGFFGGASQAFNVSPIPVLDTTSGGDGQTQYQTNYNSDLLQGAGAQGASQALDRVAQFYVEMAESIFPVVEIDVGRNIDVILTEGLSMRPDDELRYEEN